MSEIGRLRFARLLVTQAAGATLEECFVEAERQALLAQPGANVDQVQIFAGPTVADDQTGWKADFSVDLSWRQGDVS